MALSVGRIVGLIELRDQFTSALKNAASEVDRAVPKVKELQKRFDDMGGTLRNAGFAMTAGITVPIVAVGALALKSSIDFQGAMNRLQAATDAPIKDMDRMKAAAIDWGAKTQFSSTQAADAMVELAKGGLSTNQAIAALPSTLQLATAGQMGLAEAAMLSANTMATFGLEAGDMARANDALAKAANLSTIDVRDLAESFKYVGPVARQSGVSLEFTAAAMAAMGESGIKGSMGGTALRGMLTSLMTPTDKQATLMEKLGLSTAFVDGKMKPLPDILAMVEKHIKQTGNAGQAGADLMELFGDRAGPGMLALLNKGSQGLTELEKKLHDVGYAGRVSEAMMRGLPGAIERMRGSVETAATALGDVLAPAAEVVAIGIEKLAGFITNYIVPAFNAVPGPVKVYAGLLIALAAAIGPLLLVLGGLSTAIGAMLPLLTSTGILMTSTGVAATTAATGTTAMTTATVGLNTALLTSVARFTAVGGAIALMLSSLFEIKNAFNALMVSGDAFWELMRKNRQRTLSMLGLGSADQESGAPTGKKSNDIHLPAPTFNIEGITNAFTNGTGGLAASLKEIDIEIAKFRAHPAKVKDLTDAIKTGAFSMDQLKASSGLSEMALKRFTDRVQESAKASEKASAEHRKQAEAMNEFVRTLTGADKIEEAAKAFMGLAMAQERGVPVSKMTREVQDQINKTMIAAAQVYADAGRTIPQNITDMIMKTTDWKAVNRDVAVSARELAGALEFKLVPLRESVGQTMILNSYMDDLNKTLGRTSRGTVAFKQTVDEVVESLKTWQQRVREGLIKDLERIPDMIVSAFTGGGGLMGAIKGIGSMVGSTIGQGIGASITALGKLGGPIGAAIGSLAGPLIGKIVSMFGKNEGRSAVEEWVKKTFGTFDALQKKLSTIEGGDRLWKQLTQGARTPEDAQRAIEAVSNAVDQHSAKLESANEKITGWVQAHIGASVAIPTALQATIDKLIETGQLTEDNAASILGLAQIAVPSFAEVKSAADVLGVSIDGIGEKISHMAFAERVTPMIGAFETLEAAGADMGAVFAQSTTKIQPLVDEALKFGREMPDAMRPWLQRMVDSGLLVDENGEKLKDLSRLNFAEPLTAALDRLILKLDEFISGITDRTIPALQNLGNTRIPTIKIPYEYDQTGGGVVQQPALFASGGIVGRNRLLQFPTRGTDSVHAMLTPGEVVLNAAQQDNVASALHQSDPFATADVTSRPLQIHMYQDGRKTAEVFVPHLADIINVNVA
jgi:TP901 family phage tail tape measure protein